MMNNIKFGMPTLIELATLDDNVTLCKELDIANFNEKISKAYLDTVSEVIAIAKIIECPIINMHMNCINFSVSFKLRKS